MKSYTIDLNNRKINFKYRSVDCVNLEAEVKMPILKYVQNEDVTMCINLLLYARKFENENFTKEEACNLYDELISAGWTYKKIVQDIIYETLVVSGFLTKKEWEETKEITEMMEEKMKKRMLDSMESI